MGVFSIFLHDTSTFLSGAGACIMAVVLYQQQDFKERLVRIENHLIGAGLSREEDNAEKARGNHG